MAYFEIDPRKAETEMNHYTIAKRYLYTIALNECLQSHVAEVMQTYLAMWNIDFSFSLECFWFCLTGLKKDIYYGIYGLEAMDYLNIFDHIQTLIEEAVSENGYQANTFMIEGNNEKQIGILFSRGKSPKCTPKELAKRIDLLEQQVYEEMLYHGSQQYRHVTVLSEKLHGFEGIRKGYLETRKLNNLSFFRMEPGILTTQGLTVLRRPLNYQDVMCGCTWMCQALDDGDTEACRKRLETLFLGQIKNAYSWTLLQDALSFCKHMLEIRRTVRETAGNVDLEQLCNMEHYLRIEECVEALWPVMEDICGAVQQQGRYLDFVLKAAYYIKLHYTKDISLPDIAEYANITPNYLSTMFRENLGVPIREYITAERIKAAKQLLRKGKKIAEAAELVGIHDTRYFTRLFNKMAGMTPTEWKSEGAAEFQ